MTSDLAAVQGTGHDCPLDREWRKGRFRELLKAALLLLKIVSIRKKCVKKEKKLRFFLYYSFLTAVYYE